jgi:hypothetical protein
MAFDSHYKILGISDDSNQGIDLLFDHIRFDYQGLTKHRRQYKLFGKRHILIQHRYFAPRSASIHESFK